MSVYLTIPIDKITEELIAQGWSNTTIAELTGYVSRAETGALEAEAFKHQAEDARDVITGMTVATGASGTSALWDNTTGTLTIPRGDKGNSIYQVSSTKVGKTTTVTIKTEGLADYTFTVEDGADGVDGDDGRGITSVVFTSTTDVSGLAGKSGATDTYTITYSDATTSTFIVKNGNDGLGTVTSVAGRTGAVTLTTADLVGYTVDATPTDGSNNPVSSNGVFDALAGKVSKSGDETIAGVKTLTDGLKLQNQNVTPFSGFKNYIINGNFDVWQRGFSQTAHGYGSDDRWENINNISTKTHLRVTCTDTERALFNANYFSRTVATYISGTNSIIKKNQHIEDITRLAGKTVTISFWAKADSNKKMNVQIVDFYGSGGTPTANGTSGVNFGNVDLTSTWTKYKLTSTLPSLVGKTLGTDGPHTSYFRLDFGFTFSSDRYEVTSYGMPSGQSGTFDIAQVQLEEGSVATPFENRPYGLELSLCQRYYQTVKALVGYRGGSGTLIYRLTGQLSTNMRTAPSNTIVDTVQIQNATSGSISALSSLGANYSTTTFLQHDATVSGDLGGASGNLCISIGSGTSTGYIACSAEL